MLERQHFGVQHLASEFVEHFIELGQLLSCSLKFTTPTPSVPDYGRQFASTLRGQPKIRELNVNEQFDWKQLAATFCDSSVMARNHNEFRK